MDGQGLGRRRCLLTAVVALLATIGTAWGQSAPDPPGPTAAEVKAAEEAFDKLGLGVWVDRDRATHTLVVTGRSPTRPATDELLKKLPQSDLRFRLDLTETLVTDSGVRELAKFKGLTGLNLNFCPGVTDEAAGTLGRLTGLRDLSLRGTGVTDRGVRAVLPNLPNLTALCIGGDQVTDQALAAIAARPRLTEVNLKDSKLVTGKGLKELARLKELRYLEVVRCPEAGSGVPELAGLTGLRELYLVGVPVSAEGMKAIGASRALESLAVDNVGLTDAGLKELRGLADLTFLSLQSNPAVTDEGLAALGELAGLRELTLDGCERVTDDGLRHLAKLGRLKSLSVRGLQRVTPKGVADLKARLPGCYVDQAR
jgi:hypothetical protein